MTKSLKFFEGAQHHLKYLETFKNPSKIAPFELIKKTFELYCATDKMMDQYPEEIQAAKKLKEEIMKELGEVIRFQYLGTVENITKRSNEIMHEMRKEVERTNPDYEKIIELTKQVGILGTELCETGKKIIDYKKECIHIAAEVCQSNLQEATALFEQTDSPESLANFCI